MFERFGSPCKEFAEKRAKEGKPTAFAEYFDPDDYFSYACFSPGERQEYRNAERFYYYDPADGMHEFDSFEAFDRFCRSRGH